MALKRHISAVLPISIQNYLNTKFVLETLTPALAPRHGPRFSQIRFNRFLSKKIYRNLLGHPDDPDGTLVEVYYSVEKRKSRNFLSFAIFLMISLQLSSIDSFSCFSGNFFFFQSQQFPIWRSKSMRMLRSFSPISFTAW